MMNGGAPSMSGAMDMAGGSDSMTKGFAALGDQGDPMKMASSGAIMPGANPSPSNGLNAAPTIGQGTPTPVANTLAPLAQKAMGLSPQQVQQLIAYAKAKAMQRQNYGG